jgi:hypothetical protein
MAEKLNLNRFKSSGVYTIEVDESTNLALPISTGRLVIGSSKKGPINSVVLVNDTRTLNAVYGEIDTKLEKNGSYFHRTIDVGLRQGPVFALNVLPVADEDTAAFGTFNTESASNNSVWGSNLYTDSMSKFYNTQKLWYADSDAVNKWKNINLGDDYILDPTNYGNADKDANKIITITNLSRKDITVWARVADTTGYDISVKDYYRLLGDKVEVPEFLNVDDIIANYFVELIVVEGTWTDYLSLAKDPIYKLYFTESGIREARISDFVALKEVTLLAKVQGSIIPDFMDLTGNTAAIDSIFNRRFAQIGVHCALDYRKIDKIDLTEASFDSGSSIEGIATQRIDLVGHGFNELNVSDEERTQYIVDDGVGTPGSYDINPVGLVDVLSYTKPASSEFYFLTTAYSSTYAIGDVYVDDNPLISNIIAVEGSKLYEAYTKGFISVGDLIQYGDPADPNVHYLGTDGEIKTQIGMGTSIKYLIFKAYSDVLQANQEPIEVYTDGDDYIWIVKSVADKFTHSFDLADDNQFINWQYFAPNKITFEIHPNLYGNPARGENTALNVAAGFDGYNTSEGTNSPKFVNRLQRAAIDEFFKPGQFIRAKIKTDGTDPLERGRLLRIKSVYAQKPSILTVYEGESVNTLKYTITVDSSYDPNNLGIEFTGMDQATVEVVKGIKNFVDSLKGLMIPMMNLTDSELYPNGTYSRQNDILDFVMEGSNLGATLADNETVDFRYIIDSFEGQIDPNAKSQIVQLAANHGKALAICNAPSFAQYERNVDPSFIDLTTRLVSAEAISTGGDLNSNPAFTNGFASGDKNGIAISTYSAYFMPNIIIFENGKNKSIPPAMYVGNAFMKKYTSGNTFSIVGGRRGILTDGEISGVEYDLTNEDRDFLEPAGFNLIVRRRGFGVMVFSNNTGYQRVKSALNNIHVREALVTIERDIERILLNFLFDFNDVTTRMRVKTLIKNYLAAVQDARGIASADVIFDDSNNGTEVLENNAGVVDIIVDFPRGIHKFINRITITRAGGQLASNSTGFTPSF